MFDELPQEKIIWGIVLVGGLPFAVILLSEMTERLRREDNPLARTLNYAKQGPLLALGVFLLLEKIVEMSAEATAVRVVATVLWLSVAYTILVFFGDLTRYGAAHPRSSLATVPTLMFAMGRAIVVLVAGAYVLGFVWGIDLGGIATALGIGSLVIALALQDTLSNLVSGVLLLFEKPFSEGDWLTVGDVEGRVIEINWRAVRLQTRSQNIVIIPNGKLGGETICNYSLLNKQHAEVFPIRFALGDPPNRIKRVLQQAAIATRDVVKDPPPIVSTQGFGDYAVNYNVIFRVADYGDVKRIRDELATRIYYAAKRAGLTIPYPTTYEYQVTGEPPEQRKDMRPLIGKHLRSLSYFSSVDRAKIDRLVEDAQWVDYGSGEEVVCAGEFDKDVYVICAGLVTLSVPDSFGEVSELAHLGPGELFGEMAMLPDEASPVTATVVEDVEAVRLPAETVTRLASSQPEFAVTMSDFIDQRKRAVAAVSRKSAVPRGAAAASPTKMVLVKG